jgi:hypothetical protein
MKVVQGAFENGGGVVKPSFTHPPSVFTAKDVSVFSLTLQG